MILDTKASPLSLNSLSSTSSHSTKPLRERPLDLLYVAFFYIHIPATLLLDLQALYPKSLVPAVMSNLPALYVAMSQDPLVGGDMGYFGPNYIASWFKAFLILEMIFQLPVFVYGIRDLRRESRSIYVLLLIYGASTATTTLACIAVILTTPTTSAQTVVSGVLSVTEGQRLLLLSSYVPFFLVPLGMTFDMASRILNLIRTSERIKFE